MELYELPSNILLAQDKNQFIRFERKDLPGWPNDLKAMRAWIKHQLETSPEKFKFNQINKKNLISITLEELVVKPQTKEAITSTIAWDLDTIDEWVDAKLAASGVADVLTTYGKILYLMVQLED
jgi:hypothetical protein